MRRFLLSQYGGQQVRPQRDAALAAGRSVRNAGLSLGALLAIVCLTAGTPALRALAAGTGMSYLASAALAWSVRVRATPQPIPSLTYCPVT